MGSVNNNIYINTVTGTNNVCCSTATPATVSTATPSFVTATSKTTTYTCTTPTGTIDVNITPTINTSIATPVVSDTASTTSTNRVIATIKLHETADGRYYYEKNGKYYYTALCETEIKDLASFVSGNALKEMPTMAGLNIPTPTVGLQSTLPVVSMYVPTPTQEENFWDKVDNVVAQVRTSDVSTTMSILSSILPALGSGLVVTWLLKAANAYPKAIDFADKAVDYIKARKEKRQAKVEK